MRFKGCEKSRQTLILSLMDNCMETESGLGESGYILYAKSRDSVIKWKKNAMSISDCFSFWLVSTLQRS